MKAKNNYDIVKSVSSSAQKIKDRFPISNFCQPQEQKLLHKIAREVQSSQALRNLDSTVDRDFNAWLNA